MKFIHLVLTILIVALSACTAADVNTKAADLGTTAALDDLLKVAHLPGPIEFEKHIAADWKVPLSGLLNLDHPAAVDAGIEDRQEAIQLFVYTLQHPSRGTYIVDSGVSESFREGVDNSDVSFIVEKAMNISELKSKLTTKQLSQQYGGFSGVFLSHIHIDHVMGLTDLDVNVPVYAGPGEVGSKLATHLATRGTTNRLLDNVSELQEWQFKGDGVIDVFGDGSVWAIHSPGHSPGSTAYLVRSTNGPHLIVGDATHTRWGWDNQVEPGSYSKDGPLSALSLHRLHEIAAKIPKLVVHPGHQQ